MWHALILKHIPPDSRPPPNYENKPFWLKPFWLKAQAQAGFRNVLFLLLFASLNGMTAPSVLSIAVPRCCLGRLGGCAWMGHSPRCCRPAANLPTGSGARGTRVHRRGPGLLFRWFCAAVTRLGLALAWPRVGGPFAPCACCVGPHPPPPRGGHARACTAGAFAAHRGRSTSERGSRSVALRGLAGGERTTCLSGRRGVVTRSLSSGFGGSRTGSRRRGFDSCSLSGGLGSSGAGSTRDAFAATTTRACRLGFLTGSSPRAAKHAYLSMLYHTCLWLDCACGCSACCTCPLQPFVSPRPLPPTLLPTWLPHVVKHAAWAFGARPAGARAVEHTSALTAPLPTTWTAHTWRAVGMAMAAIVAMADGPGEADRGGGAPRGAERDRSRSRSPARSESSTPPPPAPGRDGPAADPPVVERAAADGRGRDEARDRAVPAVGRAVADGRGRDEARDRAVLAERGHPAGNGKGGRKGGGKAGGKHNEDPAARGRRGGRRHRRGDRDLGALLRAVLNRRR